MEDPWGSDAWSTAESGKPEDSLPKDPPKWNTFERDADESTIDVGVSSWSAAADSGWGEGTNLWHAESSTLDAWKPSLSIDEPTVEPELEPEEESAKEVVEEEEKSPEPRPILPTPPLSPLPVPSVTPPSSPPKPVVSPPSPDPFGSFESAEIISEKDNDASSWTPKTPHFPLAAENEPWGGAWGGGEKEDEEDDEAPKDEWALAQEAKRKRDRKVPPELLESLVRQWDEFATNFYTKINTEGESQSWRKGLDNVDGLAELVDSLIPVTSFPPPMPFNKTAVSKSVKETLRLTRFFPMTQSSPMAHLHAAKGSTDWEKSVKAQKAAANDEWGWDLKHEPEEHLEPTDSSKDKKGGGLLSFWSRKPSSIPSTPVVDSSIPNPPKSPTVVSKVTSPATSARPSIDSSRIASPTTAVPTSPPPTADVSDAASSDAPSAQPSVVSRFFNRFSRKPSAVTAPSSGKEGRSSLALSSDDLSFLSDMAPSTSESFFQSQRESSSANSLEAMLSIPTTSSNPSKLPPPLPPPPLHPPRPGHKPSNSKDSNSSFDAKMAVAQYRDIMESLMGGVPSSGTGYAPVTVDFLESSVEDPAPLPALQGPASPMHLPSMHNTPSFSQSSLVKEQPPVISPIHESRSRTPASSSTLPLSVAMNPSLHNSRGSPSLSPTSPGPIPPPRTPDGASRQQSIALARFDNPLPPTPKRDVDDVIDFLSVSPSSHSQLIHGPSPSSIRASATASLMSSVSSQSSSVAAHSVDDSGDFGDFGDFISTPLRTPSPPKVPQKTFKTADHKPTLELVEKAASRPGRWPASPLPSPLPQPLAPPPGSSASIGTAGIAQAQWDFLTSDDSPPKVSLPPGTLSMSSQAAPLPQPVFGGPASRTASALFSKSSAPTIPATSTSRTSTPLLPSDSELSKPSGAPGLSAQDLSFFEGL